MESHGGMKEYGKPQALNISRRVGVKMRQWTGRWEPDHWHFDGFILY